MSLATTAVLRVAGRLEAVELWGFLVGLSITLAQLALGGLALAWLLRLGEPGRRERLRFPLLLPLAAFAAASVLAALAAPRPGASLWASKDLLLLSTFYLVLHALRAGRARDVYTTIMVRRVHSSRPRLTPRRGPH